VAALGVDPRFAGGYRMPPEWEPHLATYLAWPHNRDTWPGKFEVIPPLFARIAAAISAFEPVRILVVDREMVGLARGLIEAQVAGCDGATMKRGEFIVVPTNDAWIRDYGPIFVNRVGEGAGPAQIALDFGFPIVKAPEDREQIFSFWVGFFR
jgi:agmatine deiminase